MNRVTLDKPAIITDERTVLIVGSDPTPTIDSNVGIRRTPH